MEIQAPVSVLWVVCRDLNASIGIRREESVVVALACLEDYAAPRPLIIATWWSAMTKEVPLRRESVSTEVHTLDVVWFSLANLVGLGTLTPADFPGRERRAQRSGGWW